MDKKGNGYNVYVCKHIFGKMEAITILTCIVKVNNSQ